MAQDNLEGMANQQFSSVAKLTWDAASDWDAAVDEAMVVHEDSQTGYPLPAGAATITMGYPTDSIAGNTVSAMWTFMEGSTGTVNDLSGNGNDGSTVGGPNMTAAGPYGETAMGCDDTDDATDVPRNQNTYPDAEDVTLIQSFATVRSISNDDRMYVGQGTNVFDGYYLAGGQNTNGKVATVLIVDGNSDDARIDSSTSPNDGAFHTMAFRWDRGGGNTYLHLDGTQEGNTAITANGDASVDDGSTEFGIGYRKGDSSAYWDGRLSFTIVIRGLLTQAEANAWTQLTSGYLETATKTFATGQSPNLENVSFALNSGSIDVDVIGSPGQAGEEINTVSLTGGTTTYSITWSSAHTDFRLKPNFSITSPADTPPTFSGAELIA